MGKVKRKAGQATGNEELRAEGCADQTEAAVTQAGKHAKDIGKGAKDVFKT